MEKIMRELILFFSRLTKAKVVVVGMSGLEDGDVRTVCPDLCCGLTVVSPAEDVFARGELAGQDDGVHHRHGPPGRGLVAGAEAGPVRLPAGRGEARLGRVVTGGAVAPGGAGAGRTPGARPAVPTETPGGQRVHRPHRAGRQSPLR